MTISKKFILVGLVGLAILNPLSTYVIADALVTGINFAMEQLVLGSGYIMVVSGTLIGVGGLLMYTEYKQANEAKLKKMTKEAKKSLPKQLQREV